MSLYLDYPINLGQTIDGKAGQHYVLIESKKSLVSWSTDFNPFIALIKTGKNTIRAEIIILGKTPKPNHITYNGS